jgi:hypothetical protein
MKMIMTIECNVHDMYVLARENNQKSLNEICNEIVKTVKLSGYPINGYRIINSKLIK